MPGLGCAPLSPGRRLVAEQQCSHLALQQLLLRQPVHVLPSRTFGSGSDQRATIEAIRSLQTADTCSCAFFASSCASFFPCMDASCPSAWDASFIAEISSLTCRGVGCQHNTETSGARFAERLSPADLGEADDELLGQPAEVAHQQVARAGDLILRRERACAPPTREVRNTPALRSRSRTEAKALVLVLVATPCGCDTMTARRCRTYCVQMRCRKSYRTNSHSQVNIQTADGNQ